MSETPFAKQEREIQEELDKRYPKKEITLTVDEALDTIEEYSEDKPAITRSDRFYFDLAARVLAAEVRKQRA